MLRDHGHRVIASDLIDRGGLDFVADFLTVAKAPTECILTNPPYKIIGPFIRHALDLVMLAKLTFLELQERTDILEHRGLARVFVFRDRVPQMHRDGWDGKRTESNPSAFAWYVWDRNHRGPPTLHRISTKSPSPTLFDGAATGASASAFAIGVPTLTTTRPAPPSARSSATARSSCPLRFSMTPT